MLVYCLPILSVLLLFYQCVCVHERVLVYVYMITYCRRCGWVCVHKLSKSASSTLSTSKMHAFSGSFAFKQLFWHFYDKQNVTFKQFRSRQSYRCQNNALFSKSGPCFKQLLPLPKNVPIYMSILFFTKVIHCILIDGNVKINVCYSSFSNINIQLVKLMINHRK